ncbi:MAG: ACT domain-containing protein, partial [bacterium]|nr:ACT domain-containing protein [bacterium]
KEQKVENIEKGRELLAKEFKKLGVSFDEVLDERKLEAYAEGHNYLSSDDLLAAIGHGSLSALATVNKLIALYHKEKGQPEAGLISLTPLPVSKPAHSAEVKVAGLDNALIKFSRCCSPLPGDDIIGFVTRGHGVSIHTRNCSNLNSIMKEKERLIEVSWGRETMQHYPVRVEVVGMDRPGLLQEIVQILSESKTNISSMQARASKEQEAFVSFTMIVKDVLQLDRVLERLNRLRDVFTVKRVASAISKGDETNAGSGPASK